MANLDETFTVDSLPQSTKGNYEVLPAGWYTAYIKSAEIKLTKTGTGKYIAVRYDITGPTHAGRVVFGNLNINNPNPKAEEIARQQLGEIMRAIGLSSVQDTDQLIGGSLSIKLDVRESEQYSSSNYVKSFKSTTSSSMPSVKTESTATAKSVPPWKVVK